MRTDVKLGLVTSFVVVVLAGWYFADRSDSDASIPVVDTGGSLTLANPRTRQAEPLPRSMSRTPTPRRDASPSVNPAAENDDAPIARPPMATEQASAIIADLLKVRTDNGRAAGGARAADFIPRGPKSAARPVSAGQEPPDAGVNAPTARPRMETHTVTPGDTITGIARLYYGDGRYAQALLDANPQIVDATALPTGWVIDIPDLDVAEPTGDATSKDRPPVAKREGPPQRSYRVVPGDTLYRIALNQLGEASRWSEIHALNRTLIGDDPSALKVGLVLKLPR